MPISIISTTVGIPFNQINSKNIDRIITKNLKKNYENKCCSHGFIKNNTVSIVQRSQGSIKSIDNISYIFYDVNYKIDTYNPQKGDIFECKINNTTKMGTIGSFMIKMKNILLIIAPCLLLYHYPMNLKI